MSDASDYFENLIVDSHLAGATKPWLALFTDATLDSGSGTEVTGGAYARQEVTLRSGSAGVTTNSGSVSVWVPTCTVTNAALMTLSNAGSMLVHGGLAATVACTSGDTVTFADGAISVTVT